MPPKQPSERTRRNPEQVRAVVHQAVIDLLTASDGADPTILAIAQRAGARKSQRVFVAPIPRVGESEEVTACRDRGVRERAHGGCVRR
ncbi:hypothetical protein AB0D08_40285 [Kitasatospora sp. NPDC048540]|uniref:hypothetical protein n=1 Tax=Kitasatospora sp. NPDC048540 TaxID=3155634 RepID=UPI0033EB36A1